MRHSTHFLQEGICQTVKERLEAIEVHAKHVEQQKTLTVSLEPRLHGAQPKQVQNTQTRGSVSSTSLCSFHEQQDKDIELNKSMITSVCTYVP